jgi:hypothetical protein
MMSRRLFIRLVGWLLFGISVLLVLTGLGITRYEIITPLTLGILDKAVSYKLHVLLWGPFLILLILHTIGYMRVQGKNRD